ncbi:hypothetical protein EV714DRAFT_217673 [Schizophyllum commune]
MTPRQKKTARMTTYAPPPFHGTSRYSLLNVDKEEQSTRDEKCIATTRDREIEALKCELEELRARLRAAQEDAANESKRLKDSIHSLAKELEAARAQLSSTRAILKQIVEDLSK